MYLESSVLFVYFLCLNVADAITFAKQHPSITDRDMKIIMQ